MSTSPLDTGEREMPAIRAADERTMLTGMLEWYREGVLLKVDGMDQGLATTSPGSVVYPARRWFVTAGWVTAPELVCPAH